MIAFQQYFINTFFYTDAVLLDVYKSWGKLSTMGVTSRTGFVSVKYKKGDKKDMQTTNPFTMILFRYYNR